MPIVPTYSGPCVSPLRLEFSTLRPELWNSGNWSSVSDFSLCFMLALISFLFCVAEDGTQFLLYGIESVYHSTASVFELLLFINIWSPNPRYVGTLSSVMSASSAGQEFCS